MSNEDSGVPTVPSPIGAGVKYYVPDEERFRVHHWVISGIVITVIFAVSCWLALNPQFVTRFGRWGYVGAFLISFVSSATIILPAPGIAVIIAMSAALDPITLGVVAGVGSAFGELTGYIAGASGRALIPIQHRSKFERLHSLTNNYGAVVLAFLAAIPFPFFDFAGMVAGMLKMHIVIFIIAVAIGKSIKYTILILLGAGPLHLLRHFLQAVLAAH